MGGLSHAVVERRLKCAQGTRGLVKGVQKEGAQHYNTLGLSQLGPCVFQCRNVSWSLKPEIFCFKIRNRCPTGLKWLKTISINFVYATTYSLAH